MRGKMTYETYAEFGADPGFQSPSSDASQARVKSFSWLANLLATLFSLGLIAGVFVWGYKLMMRDVTDIPVVRAIQGEMRVQPDDPEGQLAEHQGLAVNAVASDRGEVDPANRLILAPQPVELTEEDVPLTAQDVATVQQAIEAQIAQGQMQLSRPVSNEISSEALAEAARTGSVASLIDDVTRGVVPLDEVRADLDAPNQAQGVLSSMRPKPRPAGFSNSVAAALRPADDLDMMPLPAGTRLVQLGAYDSAEVARQEWGRFTGRFSALMQDKSRVVQKASSGGKIFYRLRAKGFADLSQARQFCATLQAVGAECIPVVTR